MRSASRRAAGAHDGGDLVAHARDAVVENGLFGAEVAVIRHARHARALHKRLDRDVADVLLLQELEQRCLQALARETVHLLVR